MSSKRSLGIKLMALVVLVLALWPPCDSNAQSKKSGVGAGKVPAVLRGSSDAMDREARMMHRFGMRRYSSTASVRAAIAAGELVLIRANGPLVLDDKLGEMDAANRTLYHHAQPQVRAFLADLITDRQRPTDAVLKVTSLVRTLAYQQALRGKYANAAKGDDSSHPSGATVDISAKGMPAAVRNWLRAKLAGLERNGLVQATEETGRFGTRKKPGSACFHVMVSPAYLKHAR